MFFVTKHYNEIFLLTLKIHCERMGMEDHVGIIFGMRVVVVLNFHG